MENEFRSIKLYEEEILTLLSLPDKSQGRILKAILSECVGKELPQLNAMETAVFTLIFGQIKRAEELSNKRRQSINSRWKDTKTETDDTNDIQKNTSSVQTSYKDDTNEYTNTITNTNTNTNTKTPLPAADAAGGKGVNKKIDNNNSLNESLERFWSSYPRKTAKQDAFKAWKKLKPDEQLIEDILSALERFKKSEQWQKDNGQFIPYPASWLNGRRWEDQEELSANTASPPKRSGSIDIGGVMDSIKTRYRTVGS